MKSVRTAALLALTSVVVVSGPSLTARQKPPAIKQLLVIHQDAVTGPARARFDYTFTKGVQAAASPQIELHEETFETSGFPAPEQLQLVRDFLRNKYAGQNIDVIVALGARSLALARQTRELLGNPPIVALAPVTLRIDTTDNVTGLEGGFFPTGTLDLALSLRPDAQSVVVVDGGVDGTGNTPADFERHLKARDRSVDLVHLRNLPLPDVVSRVAAAPEQSIVLFVSQDMRTRSRNISAFEALTHVVSASRAPVFAGLEAYVGLGVLGGYVWNSEVDASRMAEMTKLIVNGASARDIPVGRATYTNMLDWRQLQRWQIPESRVPDGSIVLFRPQSFLELYQGYVAGGLLVFGAQLALIVGLLVQRARRQRAEAESRKLEARNSAILRAIPDLMFVLRRDGTYLDYHVRDEKLLFQPPDRFLGRTVREIMPPGPADLLMDAVEQACVGEQPVVVEYELSMDEPRYYEARLVNAGHDRVLSIVRDVTEWKRALKRNRDLAGRLITSQEAERRRIARDLHDDVCQEIAAVSVDVSYLRQRADLAGQEIQDTLLSLQHRTADVAESLRLLSHGLHPGVLQHVGFVAALRAHCAEVVRQHHLQVRFFVEEALEPVNPLVALSLFRIGQEALQNAARHGRARHATVSLARDDLNLILSIADDGHGFDVEAARQNGGLGLLSIEERARLVQGQVTIRSRPGHGTTVNVSVPVFADQSDSPNSDHPRAVQTATEEPWLTTS